MTISVLKASDYTVAYANNLNAGTATLTINKANNPLTVTAKTTSVQYSKLKKKRRRLL